MGDNDSDTERVLCDVNTVAISLLSDHPGHEYVFPHIRRGFESEVELLVFNHFLLRAQYILTNWYDVEPHRARNIVQRFLRQPVRVVSADRETLLNAYAVSAEKNHDVYDSFLVALTRTHDADALLTTDTDFKQLCADESFEYRNPVPSEVLSKFHTGLQG